MENLMKGSILIIGTQTDFGRSLAAVFSREGWEVFSPDDFARIKNLNILADTTDFTGGSDDGLNGEIIETSFRENVIKPMQTLEKFLPFLDAGGTGDSKGASKRLFYVSSACASINATRDTHGFAYKMSKAALHQFLQMVHNRLFSRYTLRLFDPMTGKIPPETAAESAFLYITRRRGTENHDPLRDDENTLVLRDAEGRAHSW